MAYLIPAALGRLAISSRVDTLNSARCELESLLLRRATLNADITRLRRLLKRRDEVPSFKLRGAKPGVTKHTAAKSLSAGAFWKDHFEPRSGLANYKRTSLVAYDVRRLPVYTQKFCLGQSKLRRACRIALMETSGPASLETIYDRVQRRGSYNFASYKRPLRAILFVMNAMVKQGEAAPVSDAGAVPGAGQARRWRWESPARSFENEEP